MSWSEISRRYVKGEPELWWPEKWRAAAENVKQGSSDDEWPQTTLRHMMTTFDGTLVASKDTSWEQSAREVATNMVSIYTDAVLHGMAPEQARMLLPLNMMTEWHWTGSLLAWAHLWNLRTEEHAQKECQDCVRLIGPKMRELFPVSWGVLTS